jgi:hypothetical protein
LVLQVVEEHLEALEHQVVEEHLEVKGLQVEEALFLEEKELN